jgi:hypothetical protein
MEEKQVQKKEEMEVIWREGHKLAESMEGMMLVGANE